MPEPTIKITDFDAIRLKLASPEAIRSWSYGEVTKPETINYRTQKPEKSGLFAEEIFGPSKDWECYCGKYKKIRYKGIVCDKCGVEVTHSIVRRERMGHIELSAPVSHIWFLRGVPSKIGTVLDMSAQALEKVIYFGSFIVTQVDEEAKKATIEQLKSEYKSKRKMIENEYKRDVERSQKNAQEKNIKDDQLQPELEKLYGIKENKLKELEKDFTQTEKDLKELKILKIISEADYQDYSLKYGHIFRAGIGAEAVHELLSKINVKETIKNLEEELEKTKAAKQDRLVRRIKLLKSLDKNGIRPEWMILNVVPVIPPDLRPMVALDGGRFATSDLNDLYRRVINRNNRLKRLKELNAPEVISRNEKRMLQEAADALIDNSARHSKTVIAATGKKRQLKSLADTLKGKQGRFRQNLLGKRIDYSGRSVIVVGPSLRIDQCGIPKKMALELFKPFVISKLIEREYVHNIRSANRFIESDRPEVWDILEEITKDALVLLNRAPTLHRLGIQAFRPVLIEGKAIQVHPMVCSAFNADFDGDQMAVHVPLTEEAKREAREIMLASINLLKPATGNPVATANKDVAWGCYYISMLIDPPVGREPKIFYGPEEAIYAWNAKKITIREKIKVRLESNGELIETNVGRILINQRFPEKIPFINETMGVKKLGEVVRLCLEYYGNERTAQLLDELKELGFKQVTLSGYSWGMGDLPVIEKKKELIEKGNQQVNLIQEQYAQGLLTSAERHSQIITVWTDVKDEIIKLSKESLDKEGTVYTMIESGARGSWGQLTQMIGMKGLVSNPANDIIELPVKSNFREGFDVLEFFISTHGARKGLSDTALRTANAGYLTRRLVDVSQDIVIMDKDCKDKEGIILNKKEQEDIGESIINRMLGRYTLSDIKNPKTGKVLIKKDTLITEEDIRKIEGIEIEEAHVRSVISCKMRRGVCQKCYGYDLAYNKLVESGAAVGIIAAQSIGEPGTQLTMRTFHTGGVAGQDITQGLPRVEELFEARPPKRKAIIADVAGKITVEKTERKIIESPTGQKYLDINQPGQRIVKIQYEGVDEEKYKIDKGDKINVKDGDKVFEGDEIITRKDAAIAARQEGTVKIEDKNLIIVFTRQMTHEYIIPPGVVIWVKDGDEVQAGDQLTEGDLDLQQLYRLKGAEAVKNYLLKEILFIYSSQGQKLNSKHIELIIRQMFSRVYIVDAGDTDLLPGDVVEKSIFLEQNERVEKQKGEPAKADELFLGVSKVSLSTESFLSAASFQETARVLINAAVTGKIDKLEGLKENVIIGRLIPAGTGYEEE